MTIIIDYRLQCVSIDEDYINCGLFWNVLPQQKRKKEQKTIYFEALHNKAKQKIPTPK